MRRWLVKRQSIIIWSIAIAFVAGVIWWGIAGFISARRASQGVSNATQNLSPEDALAYLTKDGTPLDSEYWIFDGELETDFQDVIDYYRLLGAHLDDVFDYPVLKANILKDLTDQKVIRYYAANHNLLPSKDEVNAELEKQVKQLLSNEQSKNYFLSRYGSEENLKRHLKPRVEASMILSRVKNAVVNVSDEDMKKYYEENRDAIRQNYEEAKVRHILVSDEATAERLKNEISAGTITFEKAASEFSLDRQTATKGGELGWIKHGQTVPEFEKAAFDATIGELVGPLKTIYGYHLLEVEDRVKLDSFDDLKNATQVYSEIKTKLENDRFRKWEEDFMASERLSWVINDEVMKMYSEYANGGEAKHKELFDYLDSQLFTSATDSTAVELVKGVDEQLMALYEVLAEELEKQLENEELDYTRFVNLTGPKKDFDDSLLNESTETLSKKANEYMKLAQEATSEDVASGYLDKYFAYYDAYLVKDILSRYPDLTPDEAKKRLEEVKAKVEELKHKRKLILYALYDVAPSSQKVVSKLYDLDPSNPEIRYAYFKSRYDNIKDYIKDPKIYQAYGQYLQPEVAEIRTGLEALAHSSKVATDLRTSSLEILAEMSESLGDVESEITYLRSLKRLDPSYSGIDEVIASLEKTLEASGTNVATSTEGTTPSTSTPLSTGSN